MASNNTDYYLQDLFRTAKGPLTRAPEWVYNSWDAIKNLQDSLKSEGYRSISNQTGDTRGSLAVSRGKVTVRFTFEAEEAPSVWPFESLNLSRLKIKNNQGDCLTVPLRQSFNNGQGTIQAQPQSSINDLKEFLIAEVDEVAHKQLIRDCRGKGASCMLGGPYAEVNLDL